MSRILHPAIATPRLLAGSTDSRAREWRPPQRHGAARKEPGRRERGIALVLALTTIAILAVVLADMHENTGASYALATTQRDRLKAEYVARSGINLTRLLISAEPQIRQVVAPLYQSILQSRRVPQIPVWAYANEVLQPFLDYERAQGLADETGIDFSVAQGLGDLGGRCEILAFSENGKLNLSNPLHLTDENGRLSVAMQVFAMIGGYQSPSPYDPLFEQRDPDGLITSRLDIVSALIDWWDADTQRTVFDPGASAVNPNGGAEDDVYQSFDDPYRVKNAPFDSLEELRYVRGVGDDFWATFVEPDPDDPMRRAVTVYGSGKVNPNEAEPEVLLARTCSILTASTLCTDPAEALKFITVLRTLRAQARLPWFPDLQAYYDFLQGSGTLYTLLSTFAGPELMFRPISITAEQRTRLNGVLVTGAAIISVQATGLVGACGGNDEGEQVGRCTRVRIRSVINFDTEWDPPPPNAGSMPRMGIVHHWRVD